MLLTDKFVYIHNPKTGGSFVIEMLRRIHQGQGYKTRISRFIGVCLGKTGGGIVDTKLYKMYPPDHASCREIPIFFRSKPILSTIRNPYDQYVSEYEYGSWKAYPERIFYDHNEVIKAYPHFPNINFAEYIKMLNKYHKLKSIKRKLDEADAIGCATDKFFRLYCKPPVEKFLSNLERDLIDSGKYKNYLYSINWLKTENLNRDLYNFLRQIGYASEKIQMILDAEKVLPVLPPGSKRRTESKWEKYYTPELKNYVRQKERILFSLFPEYDV